MADAVNALLAKQRFLSTPGLHRRDFIYVEDAAEALARLALSAITGPVNIASGEGVIIRELLELIEAATQTKGQIEFGGRPLAKGEPLEIIADVNRLRDEVGFVPTFSLADGIARTVAWWRQKAEVRACG